MSTVRPLREDSRPRRDGQARPTAVPEPGPAAPVIGLQRAAGNRATAAVLQRQPVHEHAEAAHHHGHGGNPGAGQIKLLGGNLMAGLELWDFAAKDATVGGNHKRALTSLALEYRDAMTRNDRRKFVIEGHGSAGESHDMAEARAKAVAAELRAHGVAEDRLIDVYGIQPVRVRMHGDDDRHERRVTVTLVASADRVRPDLGKPGDDKFTKERVKQNAPPGTHDEGETSQTDVGRGAAGGLAEGLGLESMSFVADIVAPAIMMADYLNALDAANKGQIRFAYKHGLKAGSEACWTLLLHGKTEYEYEDAWPSVAKNANWNDYLPADKQDAEVGMSAGVNVAVKVWNTTMEKVDSETKIAIYKQLRKQGRNVNKEWEAVYKKVIVDIRRKVAGELNSEIANRANRL